MSPERVSLRVDEINENSLNMGFIQQLGLCDIADEDPLTLTGSGTAKCDDISD
jgi:hypothetical protein